MPVKLLTPPGVAGIAVVLAQGQEREVLRRSLVSRGDRPLHTVAGGPPQRALLRFAGATIDEVLVVDRGGQGLEVHLHGAPAVLDALARLLPIQTRDAANAATSLLENALAPEQLDLALEQVDVDFDAFLQALDRLPMAARGAALEQALARSRIAAAIVQSQRLVVVGCQNAGKSTLFNLLLGRERTLTGSTPGLTRDPVRDRTTLAGYPYEVVDTAGEGPSASGLEHEAIAAGRAQREGGLLLLVVDASVGPRSVDRTLAGTAALVIANKVDLPAAAWPADLHRHLEVSATTWDAAKLRTEVGVRLRQHRQLPPAGRVGGAAALTAAQLAALQHRALRG